jgi:hypothetical protein
VSAGELSLGGELRQLPKLLPPLIEGSRLGRELNDVAEAVQLRALDKLGS